MNIDEIRKKFVEYSKNYDLTIPDIMDKFHHSFRVMEYSKDIAISLKLNEEDTNLAIIIGLLHDIARFEQWTNYRTYKDGYSTDHGDLGSEILEEFLEDNKDKNIIITAVKNHNKFKIEDGLDERTLLFCKIIRDADKLDIMKEQLLVLTKEIDVIEDSSIECFEKETMFENENLKKESDYIFRILSFIYDLNFKYSFEFVVNNDILNNKIHLLQVYSGETDKLEEIKNKLLVYINKQVN